MRLLKVWTFLVVVSLMLGGCAAIDSQDGLAADINALETQVSQQQEWISYQATQIGRQDEMISYLATRMPAGQVGGFPQNGTFTPTPFHPLSGSVVIHEGSCCAGGEAGAMIDLDVQFEAFSANGEVVEMRVLAGVPSADEVAMETIPWEPFTAEKLFPISLPTNWTTFWVHVQYRDEAGVISPVYSDEIALEGM